MMNLFSAQGQSSAITKTELTQLVKICEKCQADLIDYKSIVTQITKESGAKSVRIIELNQTIQDLNNAILKVKQAYTELQDSNKKKRFWVWIKGVATGIVVGAITVIVMII